MDAIPRCLAQESASAGPAHDELLTQLRDTGIFWLSERVAEMLRELDDRLFEMAVNAVDSAAQNQYFDAMRELRSRHDGIVAAWQHEFGERVMASLRGNARSAHQMNVTLAFGGPAAALAASAMIHAALSRHEGALAGFNQLLNGLCGRVRLDGAQGSIAGPELLAACCAGAARGTATDTAIYAEMLPIFDRRVLANLDELCAQCAGVLIDAGIQPLAAPVRPVAFRAGTAAEPAARCSDDGAASGCGARITQVFEYIVGCDAVAAPLRALLFQLQPLALAAARADARLFHDDSHPLRRILNETARLAIGWEPVDARQDEPLLELLSGAVRELREPGGYDEARARQVLADVVAFGCRAQQIARLTQRRTEDVEQSRLRRACASSAIEHFFAAQVDSATLPAAATALLREGWLQVMTYVHLRGGESSDEWEAAAMLAREFVGDCQRGSGGIAETLAESMRDFMMRAGCDPLRIEIMLQSVAEDLASWEGPAGGASRESLQWTAAADDEEHPANDAGAALRDVDRIERGAWFRFVAPGGAATRGKLALRIGDPARLLFVDRHGNRLDSLSREHFARLLAAGTAAPLTEEDLFDAALAAAAASAGTARSQAA